MNYKFTLHFLFCILLFSISGCQEHTEIYHTSLEEFFHKQRDPETFFVTPTEDIVIVGKQGTTLTIPFENFVGIDGEVKIVFEEFFNKSELILNNIPTNARIVTNNDSWLESGGSFYVYAEDEEGNRINLVEPIRLDFPISDNIANPLDMDVWAGAREASLQFGIWRNADPSNSSVIVNEQINAYSLFSPGYAWINCDYSFESTAEKVPVRATVVNEGMKIDEIMAFIVFEDINAVVSLNQNLERFESFPFPIGERAHLVVIASNFDMYLKIIPFTVDENLNFEVELERVEEEELIEALEMFD